MGRTILSNLKCGKCNSVFPIQRKKSNQRKIDHIKDLYCFSCKKRTKHIELKEQIR